MVIVQSGQAFTFNYVAYDQSSTLFVAAKVYDVTSGTPVFISTVGMSHIHNGCYSGNYTAIIGKTYLIITAAFTDGSYTSPAAYRSASGECYQSAGSNILFWCFAYGAFDMETDLDIQTKIYDVTSGVSLTATQVMAYVTLGVYFSSFSGTIGEVYEIISTVYTDNTFTSVNPNYSPSGDAFSTAELSAPIPIYIQQAVITGPSVAAVLTES